MPAITPSFMFDFESNMQQLTENEYVRLASSANSWWRKITKIRPSAKKQEVVAWLLSTASIDSANLGGNTRYADLVALSTTYKNRNATGGLKLDRNQVEDNDGDGFQFASQWAAQVGGVMAYWPQLQVTKALLNGANGIGYDGVSFFNTAHPYNPFATANGTYANVFTGAASGLYPGAAPIDDTIPIDTAITNLQKIYAYIASIKMPNGIYPRFLRPKYLMVPPRMAARAAQITNAKFVGQVVSGGGAASADVEAIIRQFGMAQPIQCDELASSFSYTLDMEDGGGTVSGSDTTFYIAAEQIDSTQLGAMVYVDREPFRIQYYTGDGGDQALNVLLARANEFEWLVKGRNVTGYGHPYLLFKCQAS